MESHKVQYGILAGFKIASLGSFSLQFNEEIGDVAVRPHLFKVKHLHSLVSKQPQVLTQQRICKKIK